MSQVTRTAPSQPGPPYIIQPLLLMSIVITRCPAFYPCSHTATPKLYGVYGREGAFLHFEQGHEFLLISIPNKMIL